jgi:hypothetical protein
MNPIEEKNEKQYRQAIIAFKRAYPNWTVDRTTTRCPECEKQNPARRFGLNFCSQHHFAYENWLASKRGVMTVMTSLGDPKLKEELKKIGF